MSILSSPSKATYTEYIQVQSVRNARTLLTPGVDCPRLPSNTQAETLLEHPPLLLDTGAVYSESVVAQPQRALPAPIPPPQLVFCLPILFTTRLLPEGLYRLTLNPHKRR